MNFYKVDNYHNNLPAYFYVAENCCISNKIKINQIWEPHLHGVFEKYITPNSVVVECGCHIGTHTIKLAKMCKELYGFEPLPKSNRILNMNIELNKIENVIISDLGVSSELGKVNYLWTGEKTQNIGCSGLDNNPSGMPPEFEKCKEQIEVSLITIDSLNLDKLDFIKIDVEGYEPKVIQGAMNTIIKFKPIIVIEIWKDHFGGVDFNYSKNLFQSLLTVGYEIHHIWGPDFLFIPL